MKNKQQQYPEVIGIILARLDSVRLPDKALKIVGDRCLISYCIERAKKIKGLKRIVLATTDRSIDDSLCEYVERQGIDVYRGEVNNVAKRCVDCATAFGAEYFVRINGDSPFLDPSLIQDSLKILEDRRPDIVTNLLERTYPYGVAVEIVCAKTLENMLPRLNEVQAEHVTTVFYNDPNKFNLVSIEPAKSDYSKSRLVVDDSKDLMIFEKVVLKLGNKLWEAGYETVSKTYFELSKA